MKRVLFLTFAMLCTIVQGVWAQTEVSTDEALRNAIADKANIIVKADINLSNSTLSIPEGKTVTINLNNHTLDRGRTSREWNTAGQVITVRKDATLNLSNGRKRVIK